MKRLIFTGDEEVGRAGVVLFGTEARRVRGDRELRFLDRINRIMQNFFGTLFSERKNEAFSHSEILVDS